MITVSGWCTGGKGGVSVQLIGEMGTDFCPNFLQPFLEKNDRRSCIPVFHNPHKKCQPSLSTLTLEYLEGVPP